MTDFIVPLHPKIHKKLQFQFIFYNKNVQCVKQHILVAKRYISNIWRAILGRSSYHVEIERVRQECEQKAASEVRDYQELVENLRERLRLAEEDIASANRYIGKLLQQKGELEEKLRVMANKQEHV